MHKYLNVCSWHKADAIRLNVRYERKADVPRSRPGDAPYLLVIYRITWSEHYIRVVHRGPEAEAPDTRVV